MTPAIKEVREAMLEYLADGDPDYTEAHVETCTEILENYLVQMERAINRDSAMQLVKNTVEKLNDLNEEASYTLIETGEREAIADIIIQAGHARGFNASDEDITEDWRDW